VTRSMYQHKRKGIIPAKEIRQLERQLEVPMPHTCHAKGCNATCKPEYLMCPHHWRMVPGAVQREVYRQYRDGQCVGNPTPSPEWHLAADAAIEAVAAREGRV
jgi:hypothetical protein